MLVLTRREGEAIVIGDSIQVTVREIRGEQIRLGIAAPRDVNIFRAELSGRPAAGSAPCVHDQGSAQLASPSS